VVRQGAGTDESNAKWCHGSSKTDRELLSGDGEKIGPVGRGRKKWVKELALTAGVPLVTGTISHFPQTCRRSARVLTPAQFLDGLPV
jgi:hypothetical protein